MIADLAQSGRFQNLRPQVRRVGREQLIDLLQRVGPARHPHQHLDAGDARQGMIGFAARARLRRCSASGRRPSRPTVCAISSRASASWARRITPGATPAPPPTTALLSEDRRRRDFLPARTIATGRTRRTRHQRRRRRTAVDRLRRATLPSGLDQTGRRPPELAKPRAHPPAGVTPERTPAREHAWLEQASSCSTIVRRFTA